MTREQRQSEALDAIAELVERGGDADDVLRAVVEALARVYDGVSLDFVEDGGLVRGPSLGTLAGGITVPVRFDGAEIARLTVAPGDDAAFPERVATLISPYCLVGWDTGGEPWEP